MGRIIAATEECSSVTCVTVIRMPQYLSGPVVDIVISHSDAVVTSFGCLHLFKLGGEDDTTLLSRFACFLASILLPQWIPNRLRHTHLT